MEDSDLTDYEEEDRKAASSGDYVIQRALRVPRATTYTAEALYNQMISGTIDVDPEYQRDVVWTAEKQTTLIDSMLRNYYIPPIIFAVDTADDGAESRTCIDGKQRLTSIQRFMEGSIPHKDPITKQKYWFTGQSGAKARQQLPSRYREQFKNKQVVCVEYDSLTDSNQRDIFQRVQLGMALTAAEKLQAQKGPRSDVVRELMDKFVTIDGLKSDSIEWKKDRGNSFKIIASTLWFLDKPFQQFLDSPHIPTKLDTWLTDKDAKISKILKTHIIESYKIFVQIVKSKKHSKVFREPSPIVSPIEMTCIPILIKMHKDTMDVSELAQLIGQMRKHVRNEHVDIRSNDRVLRTLVTFIHNAGRKSAGKRKRDEDEDEDMDEEEEDDSGTYGKAGKAKSRSRR